MPDVRCALAALLLALAAVPAQAQNIPDVFAREAVPRMLDASLTDFAELRGDRTSTSDTEGSWDVTYQPLTDIGPLAGSIHEIRAPDQPPVVLYLLNVDDHEYRRAVHDLFVSSVLATAETLDARFGGIGWEAKGNVSGPLDTVQTFSWTECPDLNGGRFVFYTYEPTGEGGARLQLQAGRSLAPACTDTPHRFLAPPAPE